MLHSNVSVSLKCCIGIIAHLFLTLKIIKLTFLYCADDVLLETDVSPSRKWRHGSRAKRNTVSTLRLSTVATDGYASCKQVDGQIENLKKKCLYFAMMISCCKQMPLLQTNWWTGGEAKEKIFLLCDDEMLPLIDVRLSKKLMDTLGTLGENLSTLRWWSVAADGSPSFKGIYGQVENQRRKCFYFAMMIRCCWWISVLQGDLRTGREPKEKIFILCDDDLLLLIDVRPLRKLMDRSRTDRGNVFTFRWWSVHADRCECFREIDGQIKNRRTHCLYFAMMIRCCWCISLLQGHLRTVPEPK